MPTLCSRASGTSASSRASTPRRSSTTSSATAKPVRRQENGRSQAARRGALREAVVAAATRPVQAALASGRAGSSAANAGQDQFEHPRTSVERPDRQDRGRWPGRPRPSLVEWPALLMRICHQPNGRQSSGWVTPIAWMRPGGSVSLLVESRPKPTRTPSGGAGDAVAQRLGEPGDVVARRCRSGRGRIAKSSQSLPPAFTITMRATIATASSTSVKPLKTIEPISRSRRDAHDGLPAARHPGRAPGPGTRRRAGGGVVAEALPDAAGRPARRRRARLGSTAAGRHRWRRPQRAGSRAARRAAAPARPRSGARRRRAAGCRGAARRPARTQVGELHVGVLAGDADLELGGAEQARDQRAARC